MDEIDKFLSAPNYYAALGLNRKTCTNEQVDKAYRKYALKFHPDKNKNPKATQAFMKLGEMKETLKSASKKSIYDSSVFHSANSSHIYNAKPSSWNESAYKPTNEQYHTERKTTSRKRKNILLPICALLFLFLLVSFIDNTQPFSSSITKESMAKIITFSLDNDRYDFTKYYSKILLVPFYIPKKWEMENILSSDDSNDWELLREQIRSYADEIYKDKLQLDCEEEKKSSTSSSHPSCLRLENIIGYIN